MLIVFQLRSNYLQVICRSTTTGGVQLEVQLSFDFPPEVVRFGLVRSLGHLR